MVLLPDGLLRKRTFWSNGRLQSETHEASVQQRRREEWPSHKPLYGRAAYFHPKSGTAVGVGEWRQGRPWNGYCEIRSNGKQVLVEFKDGVRTDAPERPLPPDEVNSAATEDVFEWITIEPDC